MWWLRIDNNIFKEYNNVIGIGNREVELELDWQIIKQREF